MSATLTIGVATTQQDVVKDGPVVPTRNFTKIPLSIDVTALNAALAKIPFKVSGNQVTLVNNNGSGNKVNADDTERVAALDAVAQALFNEAAYGTDQSSIAAALFNNVLAEQITSSFSDEFSDVEQAKDFLQLSEESMLSRIRVSYDDPNNLFKYVVDNIKNETHLPDEVDGTDQTAITGYGASLLRNLIYAGATSGISRLVSVVDPNGTDTAVKKLTFRTENLSSTEFDRIVFFQAFHGTLSFNQDNADPDSLVRSFGPSPVGLSSLTTEQLNQFFWARVVLQVKDITIG